HTCASRLIGGPFWLPRPRFFSSNSAWCRAWAGDSMTTLTATSAVRWPALRSVRFVPGLVLLLATGLAGKVVEQSIAAYGKSHNLALPNIEYVLWAIVFGLIVANTVGVPEVCRPGVDTYEFWLKAGIVLQG